MDVEQQAHRLARLHIEVVEKVPFLLEEWSYIIGIILEKRRFRICAHESMPMQMPPIAVVADSQVFDECGM